MAHGNLIKLIPLLLLLACGNQQNDRLGAQQSHSSDMGHMQCVLEFHEGRVNATATNIHAREIVTEIAEALNVTTLPQVIECDAVQKAWAYYSDGEDQLGDRGIPIGEYLIYNPIWVREVAGNDRMQVAAIFGHELGHFINRDFWGVRGTVERLTRERDADRFAGCAVAHVGGEATDLQRVFERIRAESSANYPGRLESLEVAMQGFQQCRGDSATSDTEQTLTLPTLGRFATFQPCDVCPEAVALPGGSFDMGSTMKSNQGPVRRVTIRPFAIGRYEVTFDEWQACQMDGPCGDRTPSDRNFGYGRRPVMNIDWEAAQTYVRWLSQKTGFAYRLPTEAEWEYAASAGGQLDPYYWDGPETRVCEFGNQYDRSAFQAFHWTTPHVDCDDGYPGTAPVGEFPANPWTLHDMLGNISEWVQDCYAPNYEGAPIDGSAVETPNCARRVVRGGCWWCNSGWVRIAERAEDRVRFADAGMGFRIALSIDPSSNATP